MSLEEMGFAAMLPPLCGIAGQWLGGWVTDYLFIKFFDKTINAKNISPGTLRKVFFGSENMMIAKVSLTTGTIGELHEHPHEQMSYIISGSFNYRVGLIENRVNSGDVIYIPSNEKHQCECLESGEILDIFVPMRKDFLIEN